MIENDDETKSFVVPDDQLDVLIVEDNGVVCDYLKSILRRNLNPCRIVNVNSMASCMGILKEETFHLILLDTSLEVKGEECSRSIREIKIEIPIILMAITEVKITYEYVVGCGADGIIYKPIEVESLLKEIKRVLDIDIIERRYDSKFMRTPKIED